MSQIWPDEEYPSNDDSSKALMFSTYVFKTLKTKRRQQLHVFEGLDQSG